MAQTVWLQNERLSGAYYELTDEQFEYVNGAANDAERAGRAVECFESPDGKPPTQTTVTTADEPTHDDAPADETPATNPDFFPSSTA